MIEVQLTWGRFFKIAWTFFWRTIVFSAAAGAITGFASGYITGLVYSHNLQIGEVDATRALSVNYARTFGSIAGFLMEVFVLKYILGKKFKGFKIGLISTDDNEGVKNGK